VVRRVKKLIARIDLIFGPVENRKKSDLLQLSEDGIECGFLPFQVLLKMWRARIHYQRSSPVAVLRESIQLFQDLWRRQKALVNVRRTIVGIENWRQIGLG